MVLMKEILKIKNLTKYYGDTLGVEDLSLELFKGETFGFIGPNGAGKSTTIRAIMNLINKTSGEVYFNDEILEKNRIYLKRQIGYLPSEISLYEDYTVKEMFDFHESFYKENIHERREELVEKLKIDERKQKSMLQALKKQEKELLAKQKEQQKKVDALNKKIEEMIAKQVRKTTTLTKEQQLISGGFEANQGRLPWPVESGFISGYFGRHTHPIHQNVTIDNKGIYLQTVMDAEARAIFEGEVTGCAQMNGNYVVIIQHGNYRTVYSPLKSIKVKQGDKVVAKQPIGVIYTDEEEDNKTELYFQLYQERSILNPCLWLAQ
jgi:ABC-type branched-subunit amino acid transport system ATPase component